MTAQRPPLRRARTNRVIGGVCAGMATHLGVPVAWVRAAMILTGAIGGAGVVLYVFLLVTVAEEGQDPTPVSWRAALTTPNRPARPTRPARRLPVVEILLGAALVTAGVAFWLVSRGVQVKLDLILPGLSVVVGVGLTWWLIIERQRPQRHLLPRVLGALALVAVGVLMFFVTAQEPTVLSVIGAAIAVLGGVALAIAPWIIKVNRELGAQRTARAREAERTTIAAHLHDSVLQTLALIQQRSDPASEVARLARSQERELRQWLFTTADGATPETDAATHLGDHAATLEHNHPVRFDVVAVGQAIEAPPEIIAAAKEAMQNAARHAGGQVTVYVETTPTDVLIEVNDRGPGFNPDDLDATRFGVRESILGRMTRVGGHARIVPGPAGQGTSVRLSQPRHPATSN